MIEDIFYTAVWCSNDEHSFKLSIPLELLGKSIQQFHSSYKMNIVFLEGKNFISSDYISKLSDSFNIIDYSKEFIEIKKQFPQIVREYNSYETNCFLRWIAFKDICKNQAHFIHLDSDIILHTSLDEIANFCQGRTFMLQGCPVLLSVSEFTWFDIYEKELCKLNTNSIEYSQIAYNIKKNIKQKDNFLCNESLYRNPIGSDQDLLEYLVSAEKIMQNSSKEIYNSKFYFIQNALAVKKWHYNQVAEIKNFFMQKNSFTISYENKIVPFIHYQNTFTQYAETYLFLIKFFSLNSLIIKLILKFKIEDSLFITNRLYNFIRKFINKIGFKLTRKEVIEQMMLTNNKNNILNIVNLLNMVLKIK